MLEIACRRVAITSLRPNAASAPMRAADPRKHPRYLLSLAITMQGDNNFYCGLSENLSESGIFIATQYVLAIGTLVALSFTLPSNDEPISVVGSVQWVRRPNATASAGNNFGGALSEIKPGMGVRFTNVDPQSACAIRDFMGVRGPEFFE
jgi:uncharacterized protein (TIGR02266 family)